MDGMDVGKCQKRVRVADRLRVFFVNINMFQVLEVLNVMLAMAKPNILHILLDDFGYLTCAV